MKNILIIILVALCGFLAYKYVTKPVSLIDPGTAKVANQGRDLVDIDVKNITKTVDEKGFEHALIEDKKQVLGETDSLTDSSQIVIDSIKNLLRIKDKQLLSYTSIIATLEDSLMVATNHGDSLYTFQDGLASMSFNLPNEQFSFSYTAKIDYAEYWKRKWFLAPKKQYLDIWIPDKRATINGVQRLRIEPKPDQFDLTLNGSAQYHLNDVGLGGKLNIRVGRVTGSGSYLYYPRYDDWKPAFSLDYEIGGF